MAGGLSGLSGAIFLLKRRPDVMPVSYYNLFKFILSV